MNAKVIAFAAAVALVLVAQSIDMTGVRTVLAGGSAPGAEVIEWSFEDFSTPDPGVALGFVVMSAGTSVCV